MGRIASDRFLARENWWTEVNAALLSPETPTVGSGYVRHRIPVGGGGPSGSFHFDDNDGWMDRQIVIGDFDVVADIQVMNFGETDLPGSGTPSAPQAYGIACHNLATPEVFGTSGYTSRDYYHRIISPPIAGGTSTARMVSEHKHTIAAVSTWDTFDGLEVDDAATLGGAFDEFGARWWLRIRRVGQVFTSWDAPIQSDGSVPGDAAWVNQHQITLNAIRDLTFVGLVAYSSSGSVSFTGRCRAIVNYNGG